MALPGFTRADFDAISPYIVALPPGVPLNVCSAPPLVLDAYLGAQQFSIDSQFNQNRATAGGCWPKKSDFMAAYNSTKHSYPNPNPFNTLAGGAGGGQQPPDIQTLLDQKSSWFRLTTVVESGSTEFTVYSLLYLDRNTGMVRPVMRSFTPN
jgi:type II secretory pathway component PulK